MKSTHKMLSRKWTTEERHRLVNIVHQNKAESIKFTWKDIAAQLGDRSARQCYDEWLVLRRSLNAFYVWSEPEERKLRDLVARL